MTYRSWYCASIICMVMGSSPKTTTWVGVSCFILAAVYFAIALHEEHSA